MMTAQEGNIDEINGSNRRCLRATEHVHDRICMRAYVCMNTFVRLSSLPVRRVSIRVEPTSIHMRDACKRAPKAASIQVTCIGMFL